ncbi:MAG TPA: hypothetical protein QGF58_26575 [Myxococcota bacterium]|nr:hypothetical protein [Myxococcota bacterium]
MNLILLLGGLCNPNPDDSRDSQPADPEYLDDEPAGAPTGAAEGRLSCVGSNRQDDPSGSSVELTGYVRTLADPTASDLPPAAEVQVFDAGGTEIGTGFADAGKSGRVAVTVPVTSDGFRGHARVSYDGYLDTTLWVSRRVTAASVNGWAWLVTPEEQETWASALSLTVEPGTGLLVGSVHDCDSFGVSNAIVRIDGSTDGVYYTEGWEPVDSRTYTGSSGRFVVPNLPAGIVTVDTFGRLESGGRLQLLSRTEVEVESDIVVGVSLEPIEHY